MDKVVARALYRANLAVLARAYRSISDKIDYIDPGTINPKTLVPEEATYLDILNGITALIPHIETLAAPEKTSLNHSAGRLLDMFEGIPETPAATVELRFTPEFELCTNIRQTLIYHISQAA